MALLLSIGGLCGCGYTRGEMLKKNVKGYWNGLRWQSPGNAAAAVAEEERMAFLAKVTKQLDQVRLVDYSIVNVSLDKSQKEAMVLVNYSYYELKNQALKNRQEVQHWTYGSEKRWVLKTKQKQQLPAQESQRK